MRVSQLVGSMIDLPPLPITSCSLEDGAPKPRLWYMRHAQAVDKVLDKRLAKEVSGGVRWKTILQIWRFRIPLRVPGLGFRRVTWQ